MAISIFGMSHSYGGDRYSNSTARDAQADATRAQNKAESLKMEVRMLQANLGKALLLNEALWELIRDKLNLNEQDLHNKLYEIDMRDGELDGQNQRSGAQQCPQCNRKTSAKRPTCLYCGQVLDNSVFSIDRSPK